MQVRHLCAGAALGQGDGVLPGVVVVGLAFQRWYGLPQTGVVEANDWNAIYDQFLGIEGAIFQDAALFPAASGLAVETAALWKFSRQSAAARRNTPQRQGFAATTRQCQYPGYVLQLGSQDPG